MIDKKNILIGGAILVGLYLLNPFSGNAALDDRNFSYKTDTLSINNFVGRINISPSPDAELHIYGSYPPPKATALHNPKMGFLINESFNYSLLQRIRDFNHLIEKR